MARGLIEKVIPEFSATMAGDLGLNPTSKKAFQFELDRMVSRIIAATPAEAIQVVREHEKRMRALLGDAAYARFLLTRDAWAGRLTRPVVPAARTGRLEENESKKLH